MTQEKQPSKVRLWISYILQALIGLMFLLGAATNLMGTEEAVATGTDMGYPEASLGYLGIVPVAKQRSGLPVFVRLAGTQRQAEQPNGDIHKLLGKSGL